MFERIRSIFSKKPEEKKQRTVFPEEAEELFASELEKRNSELAERCRPVQQGIVSRFSTLLALFKELRDAGIQEERAISSKLVKDNFAEKAIETLSGINFPETSSVEDIKMFAYYASDAMSRLDITPKQAMHIQFFFGEHVSKIMAEVDQLVKEIKEIKDAIEPLLSEKSVIEGIFFNIKSAARSVRLNEERAKEVLDEIVELKKMRENYAFNDLTELERLREELKQLAERRSQFKERVTSDFISVSRLLKKYRHHEHFALKSDERLLDMYIFEPYDAFLLDDGLKVRKFFEAAALLATSGEIDIDVKTVQKLDYLVDNVDRLAELRETDSEIKQQMEGLEESITRDWLPKAEHNRSIEKQLASIESEVLELEKNHLQTLGRIKENEEKAEELRKQLGETLGEFASMELSIELRKES